jgi:hypothetical protein
MNDILNNLPPEIKQRMPSCQQKTDNARVQQRKEKEPIENNKLSAPPRVDTATTSSSTDKPAIESQQRGVASYTRSKYARAIAEIGKRCSPRLQALDMTELAQAIMGDNPKGLTQEYANEVFDEETGELLKYRKLINHPKYHEVWRHSSANEFGRLAQGVGGRILGTNTIFFIHKHEIPPDRWNDVTYAKFVCELKPNKLEVHRT